jgi:hypothetical protein
MNNKNFINGLAVLAAGLFASSISSFLEHFPLLRNATELTRGFFDGLSAVAFVVAIIVLVRNKGVKNDKT